jgi:hypothetical protein
MNSSAPSDSVSLCQKRLKQIVHTLEIIGQFSHTLEDLAEIELKDSLERHFNTVFINHHLKIHGPELRLRSNKLAIGALFSGIFETLREFLAQGDPSEIQVETFVDPQPSLTIRSPLSPFASQLDECSFSSLSEYFCDTLDLDMILPVCIDSLIAEHGFSLQLKSNANLEIHLSF